MSQFLSKKFHGWFPFGITQKYKDIKIVGTRVRDSGSNLPCRILTGDWSLVLELRNNPRLNPSTTQIVSHILFRTRAMKPGVCSSVFCVLPAIPRFLKTQRNQASG
jgi:hypothetical protein